jgi:hypothetical protein
VVVEGELTQEYLATAQACCERALEGGKPVQVFLRDVSIVDDEGRAFLVSLVKRGVSLGGSGVYTKQLVRMSRQAAHCLHHSG